MQAPSEISSLILVPLLNSGVSSRFVESFFTDLGTHSDQKLEQSIIPKLLEDNLWLFPCEVIRLFRIVKSYVQLRTIFWEQFLRRQLQYWTQIFKVNAKLVRLFGDFFAADSNLSKVWSIINEIRVFPTTPMFLWSEDYMFLPHLMSVRDLSVLVKMLARGNLLPKGFRVSEFCAEVSPSLTFWVKVYQADGLQRGRYELFDVPLLEVYFDMKLKVGELERQNQLMNIGQLMLGWEGDRDLLTERISFEYDIMYTKLRTEFEQFDREWKGTAGLDADRGVVALLRTIAPGELTDIAARAFTIARSRGVQKLIQIVEIMKLIDVVRAKAPDMGVFKAIIGEFLASNIASVVVLLSCVAMGDLSIHSLISEEEIQLWGTFASLTFAMTGSSSWTDKVLALEKEMSGVLSWLHRKGKFWL
jgi:hypothetical protein